MSQASNYLEAALLDHLFDLAAYTPPASVYLALFTAAPSDAGGGTEVIGGSYARLGITNDATEWSRASNVVTNDNLLTFATASANWGTVTHWALMDDPTAGNMLIWGALSSSQVVNTGSTFRVAAGQLSVTYNARSNYTAGKLLDHLFGIASFTPPANVHIALFTANPSDAGGGTEVSTSGTAYARESVPLDATGWSRSGNSVTNDAAIEWATATAPFGIVTSQAAFDDPTAGNMLWWKTLDVNQTINTGSQFEFAAGQLAYTLD